MYTPDLVEATSLLVGLFGCSPQKMILPNFRGKDKEIYNICRERKGKRKPQYFQDLVARINKYFFFFFAPRVIILEQKMFDGSLISKVFIILCLRFRSQGEVVPF